ncbi:MAG TPA: glycosyltransferase [Tepidisphaeraceae bacterium]|nr:glycosyltransferase [Tepidisphaeraceae bacterium]
MSATHLPNAFSEAACAESGGRRNAPEDRGERVSIIIPALDEGPTLPRCLQSVIRQEFDGVMRLIVVDNGSTDDTVAIARSWIPRFEALGHKMVVLQTGRPNKCAALNMGDGAAAGDCRIYLDADTELSPNCVASVVAALCDGSGIGFCSPKMEVARGRSWVTRRYARVWTALPWVCGDVIGGGFYAVGAAGRRRWGEFPDLLSEDSFAQAQFRRDERRVIPGARFIVRLPEGFSDLVKVRARWITGNRQLSRMVNGEWGRAAFPLRNRLISILARPGLWFDLPLYLFVNACALSRVRKRQKLGTSVWERARPDPLDDSDQLALHH